MSISKRMGTVSENQPIEDEESHENKTGGQKIVTVEDMLNLVIGADDNINVLKFLGLFMAGMLASMAGPILSYAPVFAGFLNYKDWKCISTKCFDILANFTDDPEKFYIRDTICNNSMQPLVDFEWTINRTSYALEWGLICADEDKLSNLESFFFIGAFVGLILGTFLFDKIGRKATCLLSIAISSISCLATTFVNSYDIMLALRVVHGIGAFTTAAGVELLSIELSPSNLRNLCQIVGSCTWTIGALCMIIVSYEVMKWHNIFLIHGCVLAATSIALLIYPESPRFHLLKGEKRKALATFQKISKVFKTEQVMENTQLTFNNYHQGFLGQIKDFTKYPVMLKNTVLLMICWTFTSAISYGLLFSWNKLGSSIYTSVLFSEMSAFVARATGLVYFIIHFFGRKKAVVVNFTVVTLLFFACVPTYGIQISGTWTVDFVLCLCVNPFISGIWGSIFLLTKESAPTSHRGMILSLCSAFARVGAFVGPYLTLLYNTMDPRIVFAIFGGVTAFAGFLACFNSDSTNKPLPATPGDLVPSGSVDREIITDEEEDDEMLQPTNSTEQLII